VFSSGYAHQGSKVSAARGDVNKASEQTVDEAALRKIQTSAKRIDDMCGA